MSKICVFCGKKPENKNKEHVLPQWLLRYTNKEKISIKMYGLDGNVTELPFTFSNYQFPACEICNSKFSDLEAKAQIIMEKIFHAEPVTRDDILIFLDWMDKVRIGLWLGNLYMNKQIDDIKPHIFIASRCRTKDRVLCIEKLPADNTGLLFNGTTTNLFSHMPCAFQLVVNNFVFTNASSDLIVSQKLGFPFTKHIFRDIEDNISFNLSQGTEKLNTPVFNNLFGTPERVIFYQPIFTEYLKSPYHSQYYKNYVQNNSIDFENGVGNIFVDKGDNKIRPMNQYTKLIINPKIYSRPIIEPLMKVINWQQYLLEMYKGDETELKSKQDIIQQMQKHMHHIHTK